MLEACLKAGIPISLNALNKSFGKAPTGEQGEQPTP